MRVLSLLVLGTMACGSSEPPDMRPSANTNCVAAAAMSDGQHHSIHCIGSAISSTRPVISDGTNNAVPGPLPQIHPSNSED